MSEDVKFAIVIGLAVVLIIASLVAAGMYSSAQDTKVQIACVQSGGEIIQNNCIRR